MFKFFLIIFILLGNSLLFSQNSYNKVGGIGFRMDDSQSNPSLRLDPLVQVFNQRGFKFTYAVNFGYYRGTPELLAYVRQMQIDGFQIAEHTPDHEVRYFAVPNADASLYQGRAGVDHTLTDPNNSSRKRICLKVDYVKTDTYTGEGLINIVGDEVTSINPNEFIDMSLPSTMDPQSMNVIFIPSLNELFKFSPSYSNVTGNKINIIVSFWDEPVDLGTLNNVQYHKVGLNDVFLHIDALRVMADRTKQICLANGIIPPTSWIQPGGRWPQPYRADLKESLESMGYLTAGVFSDPEPQYYNSYDPGDDKRYGINWGDFNEEFQTLAQSKKIIADRFAKHYVSIGHSHLLAYNSEESYPDYLDRTAAILDWCTVNGIPVRTYDEWAELLYRTPQNPYINVMPNLENDLDGDLKPDGFTSYSTIVNDGVSGKFSKSFSKSGNGTIFKIINLGGIEKEENYFSIWIKGNGQIKIEFDPDLYQTDTFTSTGSTWQQYSCTFQVPTTSSALDEIEVISQNTTGTIQIGGFELKKNYANGIFPPFLNEPSFNSNTHSIPLVWEDNSSNETDFRVRRKFQYEDIWSVIGNNLPANSEGWNDELLDLPQALRTYDSITVYYEVRAYNGSAFSASNIQSIRIATAQVLPVELSSFKAKYKNSEVEISWRTETEVNNYGFEIERRVGSTQSAVDNYEKIGFVNGNGNSNSPKVYSFIDNNLLGSNNFFYRLKQIDNNGQFAYSDEIEVEIIPTVFAMEQNYPNPFNPVTKIRYQVPQKSKVSIKIFNSLGEEVSLLVEEIKEPGKYEIDFNGSKFSSGVYFYRMQAENFISTKKMVIIK